MSNEAGENLLQKAGHAVHGVVDKTDHAVHGVVDKTGHVMHEAVDHTKEMLTTDDDDDDTKEAATAPTATANRRSIFLGASPHQSNHVKLRLDEDLFEHTASGQNIPIGSVVSGTPFYNLQVRGKLFDGNEIVLEDGSNNQVVAVVERKYTTIGYTVLLYSKRPSWPTQEPSDLIKYDTHLYHYAKVDETENGHFHITKEQQVEGEGDKVMYTFEGADDEDEPAVIRKQGTTVAVLTPTTEGDYYELDLKHDDQGGVDPCMLICLVAIADEMKKKKY